MQVVQVSPSGQTAQLLMQLWQNMLDVLRNVPEGQFAL